jgi:hypothetical protein
MQPTAMTSSNPQISEPMMAAVMTESCKAQKGKTNYNGISVQHLHTSTFCNLPS